MKIEPISFLQAEIHQKKWGWDGAGEIWIVNNDKYCLKILLFTEGKSFSTHYHMEKMETWYVAEGELLLEYFDLENATPLSKTLQAGDIIHIPAGNPHKLTAIKNSVIYETSTTHRDEDSYRIAPGDSQV